MKAIIVAGEASGDLYGAKLASGLVRRIPHLVLAGMGGDQMSLSGIDLLYHHRKISVVGVFEVASKLQHLREANRRLRNWIVQNKPDFAILIDFPDFNFRLARFLKRQHIPVFYYVSPQLWAWRKRRIFFLKDHIDLMISILPFEEAIYKNAGVPVVYTGHPLIEMVEQELMGQPSFSHDGRPLVGLMPGSREVEVRRHLPILSQTVSRMRQEMDLDVLLISAPSLQLEKLELPFPISIIKENRYSAMRACDLMLVASGTSTLESAILGTPLFIVYKVGGLSWQLGKLLVRVPYYGLVNWIAGKKCIPEYMQGRMNSEILAKDSIEFLKDPQAKTSMKRSLADIVAMLGPPGAIERAVDAILTRLPRINSR